MSLTQNVDLFAVSPPLVLAVAAIAVLVADLFLPARRKDWLVPLAVAGLAGAFAAATALSLHGTRRTFCIADHGCSYVADDFTLFFQMLFAAVGVAVVLLSVPSVRETPMPPGEHYFLMLSSFTGMLTLAAGRDLLTLLIALEVVSLPAFVLVGLRRSDPRSTEAALKFFVVSVVSTAVSVYGMSLVYGLTGSLQLDRIAAALAAPSVDRSLAAGAVVLTVIAFAFKISAVPFHAWAPDTYQGAPVPVAAFLSTVSKAAGFAGLLLVVLVGFPSYADVWGPVLAALAVLTMTMGNLVALRQQHMVRLLAWSSIAQAGYMLVPLGVAATAAGRDAGILHDAAGATMAYVAIYAVMNLGAFACVTAVARRTPRNLIEDYRGLARHSPLLAVVFSFFLLCLAGLPPGVAGLFAKVVIFRAAVDGHVTWLAVIAAVNTVAGLAYYLRVVAVMFSGVVAGPDDEPALPAAPAVAVPLPIMGALALTAAATVTLSVWPQAVLHVLPAAAPVAAALTGTRVMSPALYGHITRRCDGPPRPPQRAADSPPPRAALGADPVRRLAHRRAGWTGRRPGPRAGHERRRLLPLRQDRLARHACLPGHRVGAAAPARDRARARHRGPDADAPPLRLTDGRPQRVRDRAQPAPGCGLRHRGDHGPDGRA